MKFSNLIGHQDSVNSVIAEGTRVISGSDDETVRIWDLRTEETTHRICGVFSSPVMSVTSNPVNPYQVFAASGRTIYEFDIRNVDHVVKEQKHAFNDNEDEINQILINEDGHYMASADDSGSVSIYNLWTEQNEIVVNDIHSNICTSVMFYNQGRNISIISGGMDMMLYNWNLEGDILHQWPIDPSNDTVSRYVNPPFVTSICKETKNNSIFCSCGDGSLRRLFFSDKEYQLESAIATKPHYLSCNQVLSAYNTEGTHLLIGAGDDQKISVSSDTGNTKYDQQLHVKLRNKPNCCAFVDSLNPPTIIVATTAKYILNIHGIA